MAKSFKTPIMDKFINDYENLGKDQTQDTPPIQNIQNDQPESSEVIAVKKKVGRPVTKDVKGTCKNINVAVPTTLLDKWEDIRIIFGNNLTAYVTKLIERDMIENYEKYKTLADGLKNI